MRFTRARLVCACAAVAAALGGCAGATSTGATVSGSTLIVYASQPPSRTTTSTSAVGGADAQQTQDVLDGEQLALSQAGGKAGKFTVVLKQVDGSQVSDNARTAISDSRAIAYLGELQQAGSADSIGITNGVGMLQISPTDTAIELTQPTQAVSGSPTRYYESISNYGRTFGRVVPAANHEASVLARAMRAHGVTKLYVTDDGGPYGSAVALAVAGDAATGGITVVRGAPAASNVQTAGADAVFMGASDQAQAARLFDGVAAASPKVSLFAPTALDGESFAPSLTPAAQRSLTVSEPGFVYSGPGSDLTPAGRTFVAAFKTAYRRDPGQSAIFGYAAVQLLLQTLDKAGTNAASRSAVVTQFHDVKGFSSVLGTYSIDVNGDIKGLAPYVLSRVEAGKLVPFEAMQG